MEKKTDLRIDEAIDGQLWDRAVERYGSSVTQLHFISEIYRQKGMRVSFITIYEEGHLVGGAPIFRQQGFLKKTISISPFGKDQKTIQKIIDVLRSELKKTFINYVIMEHDDPNAALFKDFFSEKKATVIVHLDKPIDVLRKNLDKKARWGVNKAERELSVMEARSVEGWDKFYAIYSATCKRDGISPITKKELLIIKDAASKGLATLLLVKKRETIIAGSLLYHFKHASTHSLNGSLKEYLELQPNNLLYWKMIELSKEKGLRKFNLGGYAIDAKEGTPVFGINRFKTRWGGELVHFNIYSASRYYFSLIRLLKKTGIIR